MRPSLLHLGDQWTATSYVQTAVRDVVLDIYTALEGSGEVKFDAHSLSLMEYRGPEFRSITPCLDDVVKLHSASLLFFPRGSVIQPTHVTPTDVTRIAIPGRWFESAAGGRDSFLRLQFRYLDTRADQVLLHAARMLREISLEEKPVTPPSYHDVLISAMSMRIIHLVCDETPVQPLERASVLSGAQLDLVKQFIASHIGESMRLTDIAAIAGLSQYHFARAFKAAVGVPPMRYVLQQRVEAAKRMLSDHAAAIASVALDTGFSSQSHFTTAFRQVTGLTPSAWRAALGAMGAAAAMWWLDLHEVLLELVT